MTMRSVVGRRLDATIGTQRTNQLRGAERRLRARLAELIAPHPSSTAASNPLEQYFFTNTGRLIDKWHHYFDIYDRHFRPSGTGL